MAKKTNAASRFRRQRPVVEMSPQEYEEEKKDVLKLIRKRIILLNISHVLLFFASVFVTAVIVEKYSNNSKLKSEKVGIPFKYFFYILGGLSLLSLLIGFHMLAKWQKLKNNGFRLLYLSRFYTFFGWSSSIVAVWFFVGILSTLNLNFNSSISSLMDAIAVISLVMALICMSINPWILKTIVRKTSQADEIFGALFLSEHSVEVADEDTNLDVQSIPVYATPVQNITKMEAVKVLVEDDQLPYAQQMVAIDRERVLTRDDFWQHWRSMPTSGSFSCNISNAPTLPQIQLHLTSNGFQVISSMPKKGILEIYFGAYHPSTGCLFLCEFTFVFTQQYFQATFKCQDDSLTSQFVQQFQLQHLLVMAKA